MAPRRGQGIWRYLPIAITLAFLTWYSHDSTTTNSVRFPPEYVAEHTSEVKHLAKRLTDAQFRDWAVKGCKIVAYMEQGPSEQLYQMMLAGNSLSVTQIQQHTTESAFQNYADLANNGWTRAERDDDTQMGGLWTVPLNVSEKVSKLEVLPLNDVFASLGISTRARTSNDPNGVNELVEWQQTGSFYSGSEHEPTNAYYQLIYNTLNGLIIRFDTLSPGEARKKKYENFWPGARLALPELRLLSDVVSLEYAQQVTTYGHNAKNFRYVINSSVVNEDTWAIIDLILQRKGLGTPDSRGHVRAPLWEQRLVIERTNLADAENFKALVGSPNVRGTAWMILEHSAMFGHKRIKSITIFKQEGPTILPSLLVEVEDVLWSV